MARATGNYKRGNERMVKTPAQTRLTAELAKPAGFSAGSVEISIQQSKCRFMLIFVQPTLIR
jgi:hypothetical protein